MDVVAEHGMCWCIIAGVDGRVGLYQVNVLLPSCGTALSTLSNPALDDVGVLNPAFSIWPRRSVPSPGRACHVQEGHNADQHTRQAPLQCLAAIGQFHHIPPRRHPAVPEHSVHAYLRPGFHYRSWPHGFALWHQ